MAFGWPVSGLQPGWPYYTTNKCHSAATLCSEAGLTPLLLRSRARPGARGPVSHCPVSHLAGLLIICTPGSQRPHVVLTCSPVRTYSVEKERKPGV